MGWSCGAGAAETLTKITAACAASSGQSNVWYTREGTFMFDLAREEDEDGEAFGEILICEGTAWRPISHFRITACGELTDGPAFMVWAASPATEAA